MNNNSSAAYNIVLGSNEKFAAATPVNATSKHNLHGNEEASMVVGRGILMHFHPNFKIKRSIYENR